MADQKPDSENLESVRTSFQQLTIGPGTYASYSAKLEDLKADLTKYKLEMKDVDPNSTLIEIKEKLRIKERDSCLISARDYFRAASKSIDINRSYENMNHAFNFLRAGGGAITDLNPGMGSVQITKTIRAVYLAKARESLAVLTEKATGEKITEELVSTFYECLEKSGNTVEEIYGNNPIKPEVHVKAAKYLFSQLYPQVSASSNLTSTYCDIMRYMNAAGASLDSLKTELRKGGVSKELLKFKPQSLPVRNMAKQQFATSADGACDIIPANRIIEGYEKRGAIIGDIASMVTYHPGKEITLGSNPAETRTINWQEKCDYVDLTHSKSNHGIEKIAIIGKKY